MTTGFDTLLADQKVMAILRGFPPERTVELAQRAWSLGIRAVEVPVQDPEALPALRAAVDAGREQGMGVGAGTVTSVELLDAAEAAGAGFTVAPGFDLGLARASEARGLAHLPGVATPSDVQQALEAGFVWLKAFPASVLGRDWIRAMHGPFPRARFVATGGIDADNAPDFLRAGADVVAVGSALADEEQIPRLAHLVAR